METTSNTTSPVTYPLNHALFGQGNKRREPICGLRQKIIPGGMSLQWCRTNRHRVEDFVTCPECLRKLREELT